MQRFYDDKGNLVSKECTCCHEIKPISEFSKDKSKTDGLVTKCKECNKKSSKQYYENNAEKVKEHKKQYSKQYRKDNAEKIKEYNKQYYKDNAESIKESKKQYYKDNAERIGEKQNQYYKDNTESILKQQKEHYTKQIQEALQQIKIEVEKEPEKYNYIEGKEIYGIIYLVHNIESDRYYVGQTKRSFDLRYSLGWLYEHSKKDTVKKDLQLYGKESFEYTKIFKVTYSQYELDKLEAYYIDYYNSYENGYNETRGNIFTDRGKEK